MAELPLLPSAYHSTSQQQQQPHSHGASSLASPAISPLIATPLSSSLQSLVTLESEGAAQVLTPPPPRSVPINASAAAILTSASLPASLPSATPIGHSMSLPLASMSGSSTSATAGAHTNGAAAGAATVPLVPSASPSSLPALLSPRSTIIDGGSSATSVSAVAPLTTSSAFSVSSALSGGGGSVGSLATGGGVPLAAGAGGSGASSSSSSGSLVDTSDKVLVTSRSRIKEEMPCTARFVAYDKRASGGDLSLPIYWYRKPLLYVFAIICEDGNEYKQTVKPLVKAWLQDVQDKEKMYLIVHVATSVRNEIMQSIKLTRSIADKIRADCTMHKDRYVSE